MFSQWLPYWGTLLLPTSSTSADTTVAGRRSNIDTRHRQNRLLQFCSCRCSDSEGSHWQAAASAPLAWRPWSSNAEAGGHGPPMPEMSGISVPRRSLRPTIQPETCPFCGAKLNTYYILTYVYRLRPLRFCHCWSVRLKLCPWLCPQPERYRGCF